MLSTSISGYNLIFFFFEGGYNLFVIKFFHFLIQFFISFFSHLNKPTVKIGLVSRVTWDNPFPILSIRILKPMVC